MSDIKPSWPEIWMDFAQSLSRRSCDNKTKVAAFIVSADNTRVLSLGYNGSAHGFPNERASAEDGKSEVIHADQTAYYKLSYNEPCGKILYTLFSPCPECARGAIQCKINRVVYKQQFRDTKGIEIIEKSGIEIYKLEEAKYLSSEFVWNNNDKNIRQKKLSLYKKNQKEIDKIIDLLENEQLSLEFKFPRINI